MKAAARRRRAQRESASATVRVRPVAAVLPAAVETALSAPGEPLDVALRGEMERRLGHDFGDVRVHADARAAAAARQLDADAFTSGADIVFGAGQYRPGAEDGRRLIAHELVHTLQQGRGAAAPSLQVSVPAVPDADPLEREAAEVAGRVAAGETVQPGAVTMAAPTARGRIARQARAALGRRPAEVPDSPDAVRAIAGDIARLLAFDPQDVFGRVRRRLARLVPVSREAVVNAVRGRVPALAAARLEAILVELRPPGTGPPWLAAFPDRDAAAPADVERAGESAAVGAPAAEAVEPAAPAAIEALTEELRAALEEGPSDRLRRVSVQLRRLGARTRVRAVERLRSRLTPASLSRLTELEAEPPEVERPPEVDEAAAPGGGEREGAGATAAEPEVGRPLAAMSDAARTVPTEAPTAEAAPVEPESTERAAAAEVEHPPERLAAAAIAGLASPDIAAAEPESVATSTPDAAAPTAKDEGAAGPPSGAEGSSESAETVDPRITDIATSSQDDTEEEAAAAEAAAPGPPAGAGPTPETSGASLASASEPEAPTAPAGGPEVAPADADADVGADAPPPEEAQEVAAEATFDALEDTNTEAESATELVDSGASETAEPGEPAGDEELAVPAAADSGAVELDSPEQPGAEPAADPAAGMADLGPLAEVEPDEDAADAGNGGGGGSPIEEPRVTEAQDVAGGEPEAAIESVATLPPTVAAAALGGVRTAATSSVAEKRGELVAAPPQLDRPTGAPTAAEAAAEAPAPAAVVGAPARIERAPAGASFPTPAPAPLPPAPAPPTAAVRDPQVGGSTAQMTDADLAAIRGSVKALPTTDPALHVTAGAPPALNLQGDADPARTTEQRAELDKATVAARTDGAAEAAAPMGEAAVLPTVAPETLRAAIGSASAPTGAGAATPAPAGANVSGPDPAVDAVIDERRPGELQTAAATARGQMTTERQKQAQATEVAGTESRVNIEKEVADNAAKQRRERDDTRRDVREQRQQWAGAQKDLVDTSQKDADTAGAKATTDIATEREKGAATADKHIADANKAVVTAREGAEREATEARRKGEEEPSGFLSWAASQAKAFFDGIKTAIKVAFEAARAAVKQAIEAAQKLAAEAIDAARKAIVDAIKAAGDKLIEIGDRVLADFPQLRDKFRGAIQTTVDTAERAVNALADALKAGIQAWLDLYAKALDGILGLLEAGLLAVVDTYAAVVQGAIKAAQVMLNALGDLVQVARDVAAGPRAWLRNLGAAIVDGVRNHLWEALKKAITEWFNAKLDAILGLGKLIWNVLTKGGINFAAVARMAFAALKKVIPIALIKLLIEKLVGMLVPAAAAVMAIIQGVQAAWGAAGHILGAISKFIVFLKAVRGGNAGPQFAEAVAAAAVAVIEFVSFWLLQRLLKPAAAVGKAIKGIAAKIAAKLKRLAQSLKRGIKKVTKRVKKWMRKTGKRFRKLTNRVFGKRKKKRKLSPAEKLARAQRELPPKIQPLLDRGISDFRLKARLFILRPLYKLGSLRVVSRGAGKAKITATGSKPEVDIISQIIDASGDKLHKLIREIADDMFKRKDVRDRAKDIAKQRLAGLGRTPKDPDKDVVPIQTGQPGPAAHGGQAIDVATEQRGKGTIWHEVQTASGPGLVSEVQGFSQSVGHTRVVLVPGDYVRIAAGWDKFIAGPGNPARLSRLYPVESARSHSQAIIGPTALSLAQATQSLPEGHPARVTYQQALVDLNPAEPKRAVRHLHEVNKRLGHESGSPARTYQSEPDEMLIDKILAREKAFVVALVYHTMSIEKLRTTSDQAVRRFIEKELRDALKSAAFKAMESAL